MDPAVVAESARTGLAVALLAAAPGPLDQTEIAEVLQLYSDDLTAPDSRLDPAARLVMAEYADHVEAIMTGMVRGMVKAIAVLAWCLQEAGIDAEGVVREMLLDQVAG